MMFKNGRQNTSYKLSKIGFFYFIDWELSEVGIFRQLIFNKESLKGCYDGFILVLVLYMKIYSPIKTFKKNCNWVLTKIALIFIV